MRQNASIRSEAGAPCETHNANPNAFFSLQSCESISYQSIVRCGCWGWGVGGVGGVGGDCVRECVSVCIVLGRFFLA